MSKHEEIAEVLTREILGGQYRLGERLPSERDLAARFCANRGAIREAMKKLEHLGIADIQPGGARVAPLNEASLDVIGVLLDLDELPNRQLMDQIFVVINSLVQTAALSAMQRLNEEELAELRSLIRPIWTEQLNDEAHIEARINMFRGIMQASGNLPVQLIAKALLEQFSPQMEALHPYMELDRENHAQLAGQLDEAFGRRDTVAIRGTYNQLFNLHREQITRAFDALESARQQPLGLEASAS